MKLPLTCALVLSLLLIAAPVSDVKCPGKSNHGLPLTWKG